MSYELPADGFMPTMSQEDAMQYDFQLSIDPYFESACRNEFKNNHGMLSAIFSPEEVRFFARFYGCKEFEEQVQELRWRGHDRLEWIKEHGEPESIQSKERSFVRDFLEQHNQPHADEDITRELPNIKVRFAYSKIRWPYANAA